jgi:uncharacterized membrane protein YdjX (TVP38/TMEM64 family)
VTRTTLLRFGAIALVAVGLFATWRWRGFFDPRTLTAWIAAQPAAPLAFIALHIAASLFFVPRTLLAIVAGLVFGMWWGVVWAAIGSVAGASAGFLVARYIDAGLLARANPTRLATLVSRVERGGWRMVALLRLMPVIPHSLTNYGLGLTRLSLSSFAFGSMVGQLPLTVAYADLGAAGGHVLLGGGNWMHGVLWPTLIGAAALLLSLAIPALLRRRLRFGRAVP